MQTESLLEIQRTSQEPAAPTAAIARAAENRPCTQDKRSIHCGCVLFFI